MMDCNTYPDEQPLWCRAEWGGVKMPPMSEEKKKSATPIGRPLAVDHTAASASQSKPGFIARPANSPVYHGFQVLSDIVIDGFTLGKITDFDAEACEYGDAFVIAPDNSRAGLVWEVSDKRYFQEVLPLEPNRWGVWGVTFTQPMTSHDNARENLSSSLPELEKRWEEWRRKYTR
jgi:hypothetical protein